MRWVIPISTLVIGPLFVAIIAGVLYALSLLGGSAAVLAFGDVERATVRALAGDLVRLVTRIVTDTADDREPHGAADTEE
jgi:hypothetical protein